MSENVGQKRRKKPELRSMRNSSRTTRRGFTLVEVLMVVGIITILMAIAITAFVKIGGRGKEAATQATIAKINNLVRERLTAFDMAVGNRAYEQQVRQMETRLRNAGYPAATASQIAPIMTVKVARRNAFPVVFNANQTPSTSQQLAAESSEALYQALTRGSVFGIAPIGEDEFSSSEVGDTDGDGNLEFIDGWGRPLRFYLYPTRAVRPNGVDAVNPNNPNNQVSKPLADLLLPNLDFETLNQDPDDPLGYFGSWMTNFNVNEDMYQHPTYGFTAHTPYTYHTPLIVSAGADGQLGLFEPYPWSGTVPQALQNAANSMGHLAMPLPATVTNPNESALVDNVTNYDTAGGSQ